jgi:thioredoxin reductase (NADPH)
MLNEIFDVVIVGSGPSGLTAAIYCARANKKVCVIVGPQRGGQLMNTTDVENWPGFEDGIDGPQLMESMYKQAQKQGVLMFEGALLSFNKNNKNEFILNLSNEKEVLAQALIIATGANPKWLGIEEKFKGRGVSTCATCDGFFFKNKNVAVIGGGNTALEEAIYLSNLASKVYLIHRRIDFRAEAILQNRVKANEKIELIVPYFVESFVGEKKLEAVNLKNSQTSEAKSLQIEGAFVAIGHTPNTQFLEGVLELEDGYVKDNPLTVIPGLFVSGDVHDHRYRQAITAAGYGCMAALEAIKFLEANV